MRYDTPHEKESTSNSEVASERKIKKYCPLCMGMVFFASNKNRWEVDTCDGCGQVSRVKRKMVEDDDDVKIMKTIHDAYSQNHKQGTQKRKGFWKTLGDIVALSP